MLQIMMAVLSSQSHRMCVMAPRNLNLTAASSVNMDNSHEEGLPSAVEDFSPQPSPNPADFSDSDRDEREKERILLDVK